jgi:hypothetical protein
MSSSALLSPTPHRRIGGFGFAASPTKTEQAMARAMQASIGCPDLPLTSFHDSPTIFGAAERTWRLSSGSSGWRSFPSATNSASRWAAAHMVGLGHINDLGGHSALLSCDGE